jgi:hypothetical protein
MGGRLSSLAGSKRGQDRMKVLNMCGIADVRTLIDRLMGKEYDIREPYHVSDQTIMKNRDVSLQLIVHVHSAQEMIRNLLIESDEKIVSVLNAMEYIRSFFIPCFGLVPYKGILKGLKFGTDLVSDFDSVFLALKDVSACLEHGHPELFDEMDNQNTALDSDEENILFEEIDQLMASQERMEAFDGDVPKFMANSFQKAFRILESLENAFKLVRLNRYKFIPLNKQTISVLTCFFYRFVKLLKEIGNSKQMKKSR